MGRAVPRQTGEATLEFFQTTVRPAFPEGIISRFGDNSSAHKKALRQRVRFVWIPTNVSWPNDRLGPGAYRHHTYWGATAEIEASLLRGIAYLNEHPKPYRWTKAN